LIGKTAIILAILALPVGCQDVPHLSRKSHNALKSGIF